MVKATFSGTGAYHVSILGVKFVAHSMPIFGVCGGFSYPTGHDHRFKNVFGGPVDRLVSSVTKHWYSRGQVLWHPSAGPADGSHDADKYAWKAITIFDGPEGD